MRHALFIILFTFTVRAATTYWISDTGSDSADGSESTPWLTVQKGLNTAASGDTMILKAGTHDSETSSDCKTVKDALTIIGETGAVCPFEIIITNAFYTFSNLTFAAGRVYLQDAFANSNTFINCGFSDRSTWVKWDTTYTDLTLTNSGSYNLFTGCSFSNNLADSGVMFMGSLNMFTNCYFTGTNGYDIALGRGITNGFTDSRFINITKPDSNPNHVDLMQSYAGGAGTNYASHFLGLYFKNNYVSNSWAQWGNLETVPTTNSPRQRGFIYSGNIFVSSRFQINCYIPDVVIANNTFVRCTNVTTGLLMRDSGGSKGKADNCTIVNNVWLDCDDMNYSADAGCTNTLTDYNWANDDDTTVTLTEANGIINTGSPGFVSETDDFHLEAGSALIGVGYDISEFVSRDFDDLEWSVPFDIGAYKYVTPPVGASVQAIIAPGGPKKR